MSRLARRSLAVLALIGLAVLFATLAVWARGGFIELGLRGGHVCLQCRTPVSASPPAATLPPGPAPDRILTDWHVFGLRYQAARRSYAGRTYTGPPMFVCRDVYVPVWQFLVLGLAALLVAAHHVHRRRGGRRDGLCPACGYDLRASPERCPECGASAPAAAV